MKLSKKKTLLPFYHTISNQNNILTSHLYSCKNKNQFIEDILYLKKTLPSLSIDQFYKKEYGFLLSFDDGLSNFYKVVSPILEKEQTKAIVFLNTDFIDNKTLFFRYKANILLNKLKKGSFTQEQIRQVEKKINQPIVPFLLNTTQNDEEAIDEIADDLKVYFDDFLKKEQPYLNKNQIQKLIAKGFYIGAHSKSHPYYNLLNLEEQLEETISSVKCIKSDFNLSYALFSFPFSDQGVSNFFFKTIEKENIYSFGTAGLKDEQFSKHFQRIPMEYKSIYSAKTIIKGELVYYIIKKISKKNKIIRANH